jgi:hypothetical protein
MSKFADKFGSQYAKPVGYVVEPDDCSTYGHIFGGSSWEVVDTQPIADGPALLFVLDLSDPKLSCLDINSLKLLPICSYINSDVWLHEQVYKIHDHPKEVLLLSKTTGNVHTSDEEDRMPNPLPEKKIDLREMKDSEYPVNEESYWKNTDDFLGGLSFFRVSQNPLWLQEIKMVQCSCRSEMKHVMSIGYEGWGGPFQYICGMPFFLGESALYVYFCDSCSESRVISQSS